MLPSVELGVELEGDCSLDEGGDAGSVVNAAGAGVPDCMVTGLDKGVDEGGGGGGLGEGDGGGVTNDGVPNCMVVAGNCMIGLGVVVVTVVVVEVVVGVGVVVVFISIGASGGPDIDSSSKLTVLIFFVMTFLTPLLLSLDDVTF